MKSSSPDISVLIVNFNTTDFLLPCLESLRNQGDVRLQIIVVDNASREDPRGSLEETYPGVQVLRNAENLGFGRANNQALEMARAPLILYLNPDTRVDPEACREAGDYMERHGETGLAGLHVLNPDRTLQSSINTRYPGENYGFRDLGPLPGDIAWFLGAAMIGRRDLLRELGGFDERFFLYGEEQDLCLRVRLKGWTLGYIPEAKVIHYGGKSERETLPADLWKKKFEAEWLFFAKHYRKDTLLRIAGANRRRAIWRLATLTLLRPFSRRGGRNATKAAKYRMLLASNAAPRIAVFLKREGG